jgi:hypothetical protein
MSGLNPDYSKRDCSLPPGCKDLIDVLRLERAQHPRPALIMRPKAGPVLFMASKEQTLVNSVEIGSRVTVKDLAALLGLKAFEILVDLLELKVMATANQTITFEIAAKVARKHGFVAKRAA